ncbi:hypothetical protein Cob_v008896 [Colletotrichum orbiculare MAFF 240422]|uniref:Uncharacterized protein n=2 Tax=Colletotrichum orbiculare species complex TaxID=2707354 RepID=N4UQZ1_COLOR|nr:hypothetical protein Cob_v008896 [Colletotrichum orbiculare MAFF 240422]TDZ30647.1 hypothetical protein C8035_v002682 [Colletotrichum spinosum]
MANDTILTDEHVAALMVKEGADFSLKYSSMGLDALRSGKKPSNIPKPNTRFLAHIIKDTDTHNRNLLAKEAAESQARLQDMEHVEEKERRKRSGLQDIRKRQMGDIKAILGGGGDRPRRSREKSHKRDASQPRRRRSRRSESPERSGRRHHRSRRDESESEREDRQRHKSDRRRSRSPDDRSRRHRHRSPLESKDLISSTRRTDKHRLRNGDDGASVSRSHRSRRDMSKERKGFSIKGSSRRIQKRDSPAAASDSDPLEEFIGPAPPPPVRSRGRGAASGTSGMDRRFQADYDPTMDMQPDDDVQNGAANWEDAVEAFRDRVKWQQNQEQRMRAAGYGDDMIAKWRKGDQKDERDVTWAKAGEKREWDRGKDGDTRGLFSEFN